MSKQLQDAYIVAATRTPIGKAPRGMFKTTRPDDLLVAAIRGQLVNMRDGGFISAYDYQLGDAIAEIVTGGDVDQGSVVSEQWLLDMERKAFIELLANPKTQERIMGMMQTGKPVRN